MPCSPLRARSSGTRCVLLAVVSALCSCNADPVGGPPDMQSEVSSSAKPVRTGRLLRWPEATSHLFVTVEGDRTSVELGSAEGSGLTAFWSIGSTVGAGSGFFYSDAVQGRSETRVAHPSAVRRVGEIRDASIFDYSRASVGPVEPHGVVLVHHGPTDRYLALVIDAIVPLDPRTAGVGPYAYADVSWYLTEPGSADFSLAP